MRRQDARSGACEVTPEETANRWRWGAIALGILVGAGLALFGVITGEQWASLVGGVLSGGSGVAGVRAVK